MNDELGGFGNKQSWYNRDINPDICLDGLRKQKLQSGHRASLGCYSQ
jgi:hypothetical protein